MPVLPGPTVLRWAFEDPSTSEASDEERLAAFRNVRDEIATRLRSEPLAY